MFNENISQFFDKSGGFASAFTVNSISDENFVAIFDLTYVEFNGMIGDKPVMVYETASYTASEGDAIAADGSSYTVAYIEPDQSGVTRAILERV